MTTYFLPDGDTTENEATYHRTWTESCIRVCRTIGGTLFKYDPTYQFKVGGRIFDIPPSIVLKLEKALTPPEPKKPKKIKPVEINTAASTEETI